MLNTAVRYNKIETNPIMDASMPKLSNSRMLSISHDDYLLTNIVKKYRDLAYFSVITSEHKSN